MNYFLKAVVNLSSPSNLNWRIQGDYIFDNLYFENGSEVPFTEAQLNDEIARLQSEDPYLETIESIRADYFDTAFPVWVRKELGLATEAEYQAALNAVKTTYSL